MQFIKVLPRLRLSRIEFITLVISSMKVALVAWTESVGLTLIHRDLNEIHLRSPLGEILKYTVLQIFPFTSETKRMGIIVKVCLNYDIFINNLSFSSNQQFSLMPV